MVGGGSRRDDAALGVSSNNVFAALDSLRKKKKSDSSKSKSSAKSQPKEPEPQVFWAPTPLTAKSWADVDDDDDDYYATTAPPQPVWGSTEQQDKESSAVVEEMSDNVEQSRVKLTIVLERTNPIYTYCTVIDFAVKNNQCNSCHWIIFSGSFRMKEHFADKRGNVASYDYCLADVQMRLINYMNKKSIVKSAKNLRRQQLWEDLEDCASPGVRIYEISYGLEE